MADISDLPMLHDIDADYTPQYVKLARILRDKIESGKYHRGDILLLAATLSAHELAAFGVDVPAGLGGDLLLAAVVRLGGRRGGPAR